MVCGARENTELRLVNVFCVVFYVTFISDYHSCNVVQFVELAAWANGLE